jgi:cyclase
VNHRIIARLDIKGPNLVKGIQLEGLRVIGNPQDFAEYYYANGIDELIYIDTVASLYDRNSLVDLISKAAKTIFIPLTVGGGIRTIDDIRTVLRAGADKVSINTAAINDPNFIKQASEIFGSSTIVIAIEAIKSPDGKYYAYTNNAREYTGVEVLYWAKEVERLGAGEILLTSVDNEGMGNGFDIELIKKVTEIVNIPVIAHGGCGSVNHIEKAISIGGASAVAIASLMHYNAIKSIKHSVLDDSEGNKQFLNSNKNYLNFQNINISMIKEFLQAKEISCRLNFEPGNNNENSNN